MTTNSSTSKSTERHVTTKSATPMPHKETWPPSQQHLYHIERRDHQVSNIYTTHRDVTTKSAVSIPHRVTWPPSQQYLTPHRDTGPPSQQHLYHIERRDHQVSNIYTTQRDVTTKSATSIPHREAWQQSQQHLYQPHRPPSQQHLYHTERRDHKVSNIYTT